MIKKLAIFLLCIGLLAGCAEPKVYGPNGRIAEYANEKAKDGKKLTVAVINGVRNKRSFAHILGEKLEAYIQSDIFNKQDQYKSLAQSQEVPVPPNVKPIKFGFVSRSQLEAVMQEQDFGQTDRVDESTAARIGKILQADAVLIVNLAVQKSSAKKEDLYEYKKIKKRRPETRINSKGNRVPTGKKDTNGNPVMETYYVTIKVPKRVGGKKQMQVSRLVRVKAEIQLIDVETSEVKYAKTTDSTTYKVSAQYSKGEAAPKLKLAGAALEGLKSLGHKIGRNFYPIVVRGGFLADNSDPRAKSNDPMGGDLTAN